MRTHQGWIFALLFAASLPIHAQENNAPTQPPNTGWHKFGEPAAESAPLPRESRLTLPAGTWIKVSVDQTLSSDRNQSGETFTATLAQPLVANGRVIARRGQTIGGVVAEAQKAGHMKGTSRLALELTELSLVDGTQIPIHTRMTERSGDTSLGRDAGAIGTSTAAGAVIGAAADGGFGAGMGAIAGAAASTIGVLVTRGKATVVYPESLLTFRLEAPVVVGPEESSIEAFQPVRQEDYEPATLRRQSPPVRPAYYPYYPPYFYGLRVVFYPSIRGRGYYRRWW